MKSLSAVYDLSAAPITFDFAVYLVVADCIRQLLKRESLSLTIKADRYRQETAREMQMPVDEKEWRLGNILLGCCDLLPTVKKLTLCRHPTSEAFEFPSGYPKARIPYEASNVRLYHERGANPKVLKAPAYAKLRVKQFEQHVTLTLRTSKYFHGRNVVMNDWFRFCKFLEDRGHKVVVIPDQEDVLGEQEYKRYDWLTFVPAAFDVRLRMAIYEGAFMNFCSSNGPASLIFYTECPVLQFDQLRGGVLSNLNWQNFNGFPVGQQFAWSAPNQRMTWVDSSFESLVSEFSLASELVRKEQGA